VIKPIPDSPSLVNSGKPIEGGREALDLHQTSAAEEKGATPEGNSHWLVWTAIGTVVAGGIVTAVVLSTRNPGRDSTCSAGLSGCIAVGQ
jgi:hypothetical protein